MTPEIEKRIKAVQAGRIPAGYKKTKVGIVPKEWGEVRFHDMFSRVVRKNKEGNTNVLTISAQYGLINQNDFFNKTVASDDKSNYYLMKKGEFAYNKSYSNGYPFGALKRLDFYDKGIVSPLYICFAASENNQCPDFYVHYFEAGLMNKEIQAFAQEGARNHGLLNISVDDFFNSNLLNPPIDEQRKIAEILATQDRVIELKEKLIAEKQSQKKYLMSVLLGDDFKKSFKLNGVTIDKKKWEKKRIEDVAIMSSGSTPRRDSKDNFCGNILWLSSGELKQKYICDTEEKISDKAAKESNLRVYPEGTFVIAMYGLEAAGIRGTASIIKAKSTISQACMAFTDLNNITNEFLYYWYLYNGQIIGSKYAQGSKQQNLNSDLMGKIQINLPSLPEQKAIADVLSAADEEISLLQKDLEQEKLKKNSLMQLLLTGLVRVQ